LMRPLFVIVLDVVLNDLPQVAFAQRYDPSQTLAPDGTDPTFRVCIEIWTASRRPYTSDTTRRAPAALTFAAFSYGAHARLRAPRQRTYTLTGVGTARGFLRAWFAQQSLAWSNRRLQQRLVRYFNNRKAHPSWTSAK
jgi:hypothetical protein